MDMNKPSRLKVPRKTLKAATLETDEPAETRVHQSHCPANDLLRDVKEDHGDDFAQRTPL